MLTRQQVLLPEWLVEHYKFISKKYNISFSEMMRLGLCMHMGNLFRSMFPEYDIDIDSRELAGAFKSLSQNEDEREKFNALLSKVYFEAKKAAKYRADMEKKKTHVS